MALADYNAFLAKLAAPNKTHTITKVSLTTVAGRSFSLWTVAPFAGAAPTTAVGVAGTTTGCVWPYQSAGTIAAGRSLRIIQHEMAAANPTMLMICDRLAHSGGLSGTVTTYQTTNLPTPPLVRYTDGAGVWCAAEIYTQIGATGTTGTINYTNQAGTSGRTGADAPIGVTTYREASRIVLMPLQSGDTGVRSVQGFQLKSTTSTAGNFGVTLFKPLMMVPLLSYNYEHVYDTILGLSGQNPVLAGMTTPGTSACIWYVVITFTTAPGIINTSTLLSED